MKLNFCAYCGILIPFAEVESDLRCENCDNVVGGPDNHIEGEFDMDGGNKLLKVYGIEP